MRTSLLIASLLLVTCQLAAQEVGDTIIVTAPEAQLKQQSGVVGTVPRGNHLRVEVVNGNWFWVLWHGKKAWIHRKDVIPLDEGITYFTQSLRRNPNATDYNIRGMIWQDRGDYDRALADFNQAIRLDAQYVSPYENRGVMRLERGDIDRAIADFGRMIQLAPDSASAYYHRSNAFYAKGDFGRAIADYERAIELDASYVDALNGLAWLLATCSDSNFRDGRRAVELAAKACELTKWKDAASIDTLAAAYAEAADFENAVKMQQQAIDLAEDEQKSRYQARLALYERGQPFREEP